MASYSAFLVPFTNFFNSRIGNCDIYLCNAGLSCGLAKINITLIGIFLASIPTTYVSGILMFFFGLILALIPAVLLALLESTDKALYVLILYFFVQIVESYFITPFSKNTVSVPPALSLTWLLLIGTLSGGMGLFLAIPMLVVRMVIISTIYLPEA